MENISATYVVVGGGIAGVSCAETLISLDPNINVVIVSASSLIKAVQNVHEISRTLVSFDVNEVPIDDYEASNSRITVLHCAVSEIDHLHQMIVSDKGDKISYSKLCICTGGYCKTIFPENQHVVGIRDTTSAADLDAKLNGSQRILIVGNGGIATELVFQVQNCEVIWAVKDKSIGLVFLDPGAAEFLLPLLQNKSDKVEERMPTKRMTYKLDKSRQATDQSQVLGGALGPDWHQNLSLKGSEHNSNKIVLEYQCEVKKISSGNVAIHDKKSDGSSWPIFVELTNGKHFGCDFIVSATGVTPNSGILTALPCDFSHEGGVKVDQNMRVHGIQHVYAAGDVCSTSNWPYSPHWHQMRLWTQARQMGSFAAQCMLEHHKQELSGKEQYLTPDICFDLFAHITNFFGKKVILLGRYNAQGIRDTDNIEYLVRCTANEEYIKVVMLNGRMQGAVLIGETDLEETFENLILNEIDLSMLGEDLLDPCVDIADYFD